MILLVIGNSINTTHEVSKAISPLVLEKKFLKNTTIYGHVGYARQFDKCFRLKMTSKIISADAADVALTEKCR